MSEIIPFPTLDNIQARIAQAMRRHWFAGKRDDDFHRAVRQDCCDATLQVYNAAAAEVWAEICGDTGGDAA